MDFLKDILHEKTSDKKWYIFGTWNRKESFQIFWAKKIIYISGFAETIPLFLEFKMYIENVKKLEYIITKKNGKWTRWNLMCNYKF